MKEIRIKISDDEYRKLTEIAKKDAEEYGITTKEAFRKNLDYMVYCFLENNCYFWDIE